MLHRTRRPAHAVIPAAVLVLVGLLAAVPRLAGAAQPTRPAAAKVHVVTIAGMQYHPRVLVVRRGEPVRWVNEDFVPHTVTAVGGGFDSHSIAPQGSWTYVPDKPGVYDYTCTFHPTMKGRLEVR